MTWGLEANLSACFFWGGLWHLDGFPFFCYNKMGETQSSHNVGSKVVWPRRNTLLLAKEHKGHLLPEGLCGYVSIYLVGSCPWSSGRNWKLLPCFSLPFFFLVSFCFRAVLNLDPYDVDALDLELHPVLRFSVHSLQHSPNFCYH